jgi:very-short-patch-repair endonuclease
VSKGAEELLKIVQEIFSNQRIELEYNVASTGGLFLDIYLPRLKIAFEFDGEQHSRYIEHFHGDRQGFIQACRRDTEKDRLCQEKGITLIRIANDEEMTIAVVSRKIVEALDG